MKRLNIAVLALAVLLTVAGVSATDRAVRAEANRVFRQGGNLLRQDRYNEALARFERVAAYRPRPNVFWNIAACHLYLGHRDLSLWFLDRYLAGIPDARASLEMQQALRAIAEQNEYIQSLEERERLWNQVAAADELASDGEATPAEPPSQSGGVGAADQRAAARSQAASAYGTELFRIGLQQISEGNWEGGKTFFERALAYRMLRNAAFNIATIHLAYGRRDLALHFYRMFIENQPAVQNDSGVAAALRAIEESSPRVGDEQRRNELSDQMSSAVERALGTTRTAPESPVESPTSTVG